MNNGWTITNQRPVSGRVTNRTGSCHETSQVPKTLEEQRMGSRLMYRSIGKIIFVIHVLYAWDWNERQFLGGIDRTAREFLVELNILLLCASFLIHYQRHFEMNLHRYGHVVAYLLFIFPLCSSQSAPYKYHMLSLYSNYDNYYFLLIYNEVFKTR